MGLLLIAGLIRRGNPVPGSGTIFAKRIIHNPWRGRETRINRVKGGKRSIRADGWAKEKRTGGDEHSARKTKSQDDR